MGMKAVIILSGGPDSATVLYWAKSQGYDLYPITFLYGQKASVEVKRAAELATAVGAPHKIVDLSGLASVYVGVTSLVDRGMEVTREFTSQIIVPFRNGVFMAVAVAYAESVGAEYILYGAQGSDEPKYPDCRQGFYEAFQEAARQGTDHPIRIDAPFIGVPKSELIRRAVELGVPLNLTWSCYNEGPIHCGRCESCLNRKRAFTEAGVNDPTEYRE